MPDVVVRLPGALAAYADGAREVVVEVTDADLRSVLGALADRHPGVVARTLDQQGDLRRHINVFVGNDNARDLDGLATRVPEGSAVSIIPAISGG